MPNDQLIQIECPKCAAPISLTEALTSEIEEKYKAQFSQRLQSMEKELRDRQTAIDQQKQQFQKQVEAAREQFKREQELSKKQLAQQIEAEKQRMAAELQQKLAQDKAALEKKLRDDIAAGAKVEMEDLKAQLGEKARRLDEAVKNELELRKKARELEEKEKQMELELQRKLDEEKTKLADEIGKRITDDYRLKAMEKDKQLDDMRKQIEDLKRKAEQSSQQMQGEVLELEIEASLRAQFPTDDIEPVAKGMRGADVIQRVMTATGQAAGSIIWEMKRTKAWSDGWVEKLKEDQRAVTAEFAVIVTQAMPKGVRTIGVVDGVWVVEACAIPGLAACLRTNILQLYHARNASTGKGEKMEFLYGYLTGTQFRQRVEAIVEAFRSMQDDLDSEKRAFQKRWAAREQQLTRVLNSTVGMYGDIQGIVGASLPKINALELEPGALDC